MIKGFSIKKITFHNVAAATDTSRNFV